MSTSTAIYRNLKLSKGARYVYSLCDVKGRENLTKGLLRNHEYGTIYATDCKPVITDRKFAVRAARTREVFAYIVGTLSAPVAGREVRLTFNPFVDDFYSIKATGEMLEDLSRFKALRFAPDGVYGIE
jgi:hypothetical protein